VILELHINKILSAQQDGIKEVFEIMQYEDDFGNNPLALACIYNIDSKKEEKIKCVEILLNFGSTPNVRNRITGFTPMHWAARYGELKIIRMLYEHGA